MKMVEKIKKSSLHINKLTSCNNCPPYSTILCIVNSYQPVLLELPSNIKTSKATWSLNLPFKRYQQRVFFPKWDSNFSTASFVAHFMSSASYSSHYQECRHNNSLSIPHCISCIIRSFVSLCSDSSTTLDGNSVNALSMHQVSVTQEMIPLKESKLVTLLSSKLPSI